MYTIREVFLSWLITQLKLQLFRLNFFGKLIQTVLSKCGRIPASGYLETLISGFFFNFVFFHEKLKCEQSGKHLPASM